MQQRQLRLGDILDDYCPRERPCDQSRRGVAMVGADRQADALHDVRRGARVTSTPRCRASAANPKRPLPCIRRCSQVAPSVWRTKKGAPTGNNHTVAAAGAPGTDVPDGRKRWNAPPRRSGGPPTRHLEGRQRCERSDFRRSGVTQRLTATPSIKNASRPRRTTRVKPGERG